MTKVEERHGRLEKARGKLLMAEASGQRIRRRAAKPLPPLKAPGTAHLALTSRPRELMAASVRPCHIHGLNAGTVYHIARWSQCKLPKKLQSLKIDPRRTKKDLQNQCDAKSPACRSHTIFSDLPGKVWKISYKNIP